MIGLEPTRQKSPAPKAGAATITPHPQKRSKGKKESQKKQTELINKSQSPDCRKTNRYLCVEKR